MRTETLSMTLDGSQGPMGHLGQENSIVYYHHYSGFKKRCCEIVSIGSPFYAAAAAFNFRTCVALSLTLSVCLIMLKCALLSAFMSSFVSSGPAHGGQQETT